MSSAKYGSSRSRASGDSFGRCDSPELSRAMSGALAARQTSGGRELAEPGAGPHGAAEHRGAPARLGVGARVVARDRRDVALGDAEEPAHLVDRLGRRLDDVVVAHHQHPLAVDVPIEVLELAAVEPEVLVAPERRPAGVDPLPLLGEGPLEVRLALEAVGPEVHPVAVRAVDRVADDGDQLHVGQVLGDPAVRRVAPQVERRALAADLVLGRRPEQRVVVAAPPDPLLLGVGVAGAGPVRRRGVAAQPVLRLLGRGREDLGVLRQRRVQRRGARLGRADDDEVGTLRPGHVTRLVQSC